MTELQLMQEAGFGGSHMGESRNISAIREFIALSRFLRENRFYDAARMADGLQDFCRMIMEDDF